MKKHECEEEFKWKDFVRDMNIELKKLEKAEQNDKDEAARTIYYNKKK